MTVAEHDARLVELLQSILGWQLTEAGWQSVLSAVNLLAEARECGDTGTERRATAALILSGPGRAAGGLEDAMRERDRRPVPDGARDVVYRLLRRLGAPADQPGGSHPAPTRGAADDGAP